MAVAGASQKTGDPPARSNGASPGSVSLGRDRLSRPAVSGSERVTKIQRARILAALIEESRERGVANITVAHIVARAGVSRRTFYALFSDREDCFLATFDEALARATRCVREADDPSAGWTERLWTGLVAILSFLDSQRAAGRLLIVASLGAGAQALERRRRVVAQIVAVVDESGRQGKRGVELPPLTAEGVVGGVLSVLHARLLDPSGAEASVGDPGLLALAGPLMAMIVLPYLGPAAARRESARPIPARVAPPEVLPADPLRDLGMRLTYRTVRVLGCLAARPGSSNRDVGLAADIYDQGQISKLLTRLRKLGLIENRGTVLGRGAPNAWILTAKGAAVERAISERAG